jgi:hypothetical protein
MLSASYLYAGYSDYFGGHGETDCEEYSEHLLYAFYGRDTSLHDIIDQLVEDSYNGPAGETLPEDVTQDDVRAALLDMLTDEGRADFLCGAVAECSAAWTAANPLEDCPCGNYTPDGEGDEECPECGNVFDNDNYDDFESPIFVVVLRYEKGGE